MAQNEVEIDLDALNVKPVEEPVPIQVEEVKVVFVPFVDGELVINQTRMDFRAKVPIRLTRDEARVLLEANKGYVKE